MQEELLNILKNGLEDPDAPQYESEESDADMTDEEFEEKIQAEAKEIANGNEAEEVSGTNSWKDI